MTNPNGRKLYGPLILTLALALTIVCLAEFGMFWTFGWEYTISQYVNDDVDMSWTLMGFIGGSCFLAGMLCTHFTNFRMERTNRKEYSEE